MSLPALAGFGNPAKKASGVVGQMQFPWGGLPAALETPISFSSEEHYLGEQPE
jgi:hypothetical protein